MSVLQYPKTLDIDDDHVWDNEAFDNGESKGLAAIKVSWSSVKPSSITLSQSFESDSTKENHSPSILEIESSPVSKPFCSKRNVTGTQRTPTSKEIVSGWMIPKNPEERNVDSEIEEIEREINRLSSRLESLRLEKVRGNAKSKEKRGKIVAAKFKDPPNQSVKWFDEESKIEESMCLSAKLKTPKRGLSMGPGEIFKGVRRGISLGPMEIYSATKLKQLGKQDTATATTPLPPSSSRRKSCYWKLEDIDELRVAKGRGKTSSLSPKSRAKTASTVQFPKQAATTTASKKAVKKEDAIIASIQPKKLFTKDCEKSATAKKPLKSGRVVASRYNQIPNGGNSARKEIRKRSLPENEDDFKKSDRKRVSLVGKSQGLEQQVVKKGVNKYMGIPSEVAIQKNLDHKTPLSVSKMLDGVPMVKTIRWLDESPRDSGPAKRVAELVGRKSCFNMDNDDVDDEVEELVSHGLNFAEERVTTKEYLKNSVEIPRDSGAAKKVSQLWDEISFS